MVSHATRNEVIIDDKRLGLILSAQADDLRQIALTHACHIEMQRMSTSHTCPIPVATLNAKDSALTPTAMSVDIRIGDLAEQSVDMVVICSTSQHLLNDILAKAGNAVTNKFNNEMQKREGQDYAFHTTGGDLLCRQLLFLPWLAEKLDDQAARRSIHTFFSTAIQYAIEHRQTSLAFPALGCGKLEYDPNMIAEVILDETQPEYTDRSSARKR